jgi:hypothetical protein
LKQHNRVPKVADLDASHVYLIDVEARTPEQGESWNSSGDTRELIASKGLLHTAVVPPVSLLVVGAALTSTARALLRYLPRFGVNKKLAHVARARCAPDLAAATYIRVLVRCLIRRQV